MTSYVDDNAFPKVIFTEGTAPATPASGKQALYIKSADHLPYLINSAGTSTAIGGGTSGALTQIQKITNGSTSAMTFSSIPGTYSALLLVIQARAASASGAAYETLQFNGDTGSNYTWANLISLGAVATPGDGSGTAIRALYLPDTTGPANYGGGGQILIPNYASTSFFKTIMAQCVGAAATGAGSLASITSSGQWASTAAITSITLVETMLINSVAILYGVS